MGPCIIWPVLFRLIKRPRGKKNWNIHCYLSSVLLQQNIRITCRKILKFSNFIPFIPLDWKLTACIIMINLKCTLQLTFEDAVEHHFFPINPKLSRKSNKWTFIYSGLLQHLWSFYCFNARMTLILLSLNSACKYVNVCVFHLPWSNY